jgi:hypothetical protein
MSYHQVTATSLTPSRPAPQAPQRRGPEGSMYNTNASLASSGYNPSFTFTSASPSGSSYASSYSGIGGSPNRNSEALFNSQVVRSGLVSVKEDGTFASWIWKVKWLVLKEQTLSIHKSEVRVLTSCDPRRTIDLTDFRTSPPHSRPSSYYATYLTSNVRI